MNFKRATDSKIIDEKKPIDISTWAQYGLKDGKFVCLTKKQEQEKEKEDIIDTLCNISYAIEMNRYRYAKKYDELHGEGAYERLYYLEPIYDNLDSEEESQEEETQLQVEEMHEQNAHCY